MGVLWVLGIMQFLIVGSLFVAGASAQLVHYPNGAVAPYDPNNAAATAAHLLASSIPYITTARGRHRCLTPPPTWSPTPTVPSPPLTPMLLPPLPTTTLPRPLMAIIPSLVLPMCTPLVPLCTDARSARLRSPSPWSPATLTPPTSVVSLVTLPPLSPPSLLTPMVLSCLLSPLMLLRPVRLTSPLLLRQEGRNVRLRCPSSLSPV